MAHPLEAVMRQARDFVLIGDSSEGRFPAFSYHAYTSQGIPFHCLDLGGLPSSRGLTKGGKVYGSVAALPAERDDLAIIWVKPLSARRAVDVAHEAGCKRVWFSFGTGHRDAVARARELGIEVLEIGRCPVYYLPDKPLACKAHTALVKLSGAYQRPPQIDAQVKHRELW